MIHQTTWIPDTCDCKITYEWNDDDILQINIISAIPCRRHTHLSLTNIFSEVTSENHTKNAVITELSKTVELADEKCKWTFDDNGDLTIDVDAELSSKQLTDNETFSRNLTNRKITIRLKEGR